MGVDRDLQGLQPSLLLGPGAVAAGCPASCPASFAYLQGWRCCHYFEQPVPVLDCDFSFSWYWARISCMVTWVHCLTSLVKSRLDPSYTNAIEFISTILSNFIVNCGGGRTAGCRWPIMLCKSFHFGFSWIWYLLIGTVILVVWVQQLVALDQFLFYHTFFWDGLEISVLFSMYWSSWQCPPW